MIAKEHKSCICTDLHSSMDRLETNITADDIEALLKFTFQYG